MKDLLLKFFFSFLNVRPPLGLYRPSLPTSHSAKLFALFPHPHILPSKKPTWGPAPQRHLPLSLGPGSAEIKARPRKHPPQPQPGPGPGESLHPSQGSEGPRARRGAGLLARPPSDEGGVCAQPPSCRLSLGVIKSEIHLLVTPVLLARADLHMKGLRRAWAFSFSHSQWGAAYK